MTTTEQVKLKPSDFDMPRHDDSAFLAAWAKMEQIGFNYGDSALDRVHLGWLLARKLAAGLNPPSPDTGERREAIEAAILNANATSLMNGENIGSGTNVARIRDAILALSPAPDADTLMVEADRSMDESGSPESVGCIAQQWIDERAREVARLFGPERCEITCEPAKAMILSVDRKPWYVATIWRDAMNFSQMVRWMATAGNPLLAASQVKPDPRIWEPHFDYAGEPMPEGCFRDPPDQPDSLPSPQPGEVQ